MNSDYPFNPDQPQEAQAGQPPEKWIHPDTLKFMGMAKDLLDSPGVKQSVAAEQEKQEDEAVQDSAHSANASRSPSAEPSSDERVSHALEDQPDSLNFMDMAKDLLNSPAVKQAKSEPNS